METLKPRSKEKAKPDLSKVHVLHPQKHNLNLPDQNKILILVGRQLELDAEKKALAKKQKTLSNQITISGLTNKAVREAMNAYEGDADAIYKHYSMVFHITNAMGAPVGQQLSFFPDANSKVSRQTELEMAFDKGKMLGLLGKAPDEQAFPPHTDIGQEHTKGWNEGQQERRDEFERNAEAVNAAEKEKAEKAAAKKAKREKASAATDATVKIIEGTMADLDKMPADADT